MDIQGRVQAALLDKSASSEFLMDLFMLCIVVTSGCATLVGTVETVATCRQSRLDAFPAALYMLSEQAFWRDCTVRVSGICQAFPILSHLKFELRSQIFEFLFHVYTNAGVQLCFIEAAKNALICSKNDFYFAQKNNWMKYIGLRR